MKNSVKILSLFLVLFLLAAGSVFSAPKPLEDLQNSVTTFSESIATALPFNSTIGLNWSDAYIGQLLGIPPHFGVGFSVGATFLKIGSMEKLMQMVDAPIGNLPVSLPLPGYTLEGRIGGIVLPFDAGFKVGVIPADSLKLLDAFGLGLDYLLVGGDFRYPLLKGGVFPLKVSVGLGVNHINGGISKTIPTGIPSFTFDDPHPLGGSYTLAMSDPTLGLRWKTTCMEVKAQASFPLIIITPYAGIGLGYAWSEAGYKIDSKITVNDDPVDNNASVKKLLKDVFGVTSVDNNGIESMVKVNNMNFRVYGGFSFNIVVIKLDFTAMYNFQESYGFTFGTRFQL